MKLRIKGNSLRLRLQRAEVARLRVTGRVRESLQLGPGAGGPFHYEVRTIPGEQPALRHKDGGLSVGIPQAWAETMANSQQVGYSVDIPAAGGAAIRLTVEKDFQCMVDRPNEDDRDAFPNPDVCPPHPS